MAEEPKTKKSKTCDIREGILFGMGNPLLDISAVTEESFLTKYGLEANNAILAEEKHLPMYKDLADNFENVEFIPGGATQNSIKVAQWLLRLPNATTYTGAVGKDTFAKTLKEKCTGVGVNVIYQAHDEATGTCAVVVTGNNRSLCANLAAANLFTDDHLDVPANWSLVEKADFFYIGGFFLTVCPKAIMKVAQYALDSNKVLSMNLSAPFLCQFFKDPMMAAMPYVDILFGNETEAATFAKEQNLGTEDVKEIALKVAALDKLNSKRSRMVVFTQGANPTVVVEDGKVTEYPIDPLAQADIVDTNGAGDAFVGGFLAQLVQGKPVKECIRCGNYAARVIIQRSGCTFPEKPDFS